MSISKVEKLAGLMLPVFFIMGCAGPSEQDISHLDENAIPTIDPVELRQDEKLQVVVTTSIIGDVAHNVGQDLIEIEVLIKPGQDPHSYQSAAQDVAAIESAHLILINGFNLEESLLDMIITTTNGPIIPVSAGIEPLEADDEGHGDDHDETEDVHVRIQDPHVWMNPANVMIWAENIAAIFSAADPAHADRYQDQAQAYIIQLKTLDESIRGQTEDIPVVNRRLITDHDTFEYFAQTYGFEIVGTIAGSTTSTTNISGGELATLTTLIHQEDVPGIFIDQSSGDQMRGLAATLAQELQSDFFVVTLYTGSLGTNEAQTYIDMMNYNIAAMVEALTP